VAFLVLDSKDTSAVDFWTARRALLCKTVEMVDRGAEFVHGSGEEHPRQNLDASTRQLAMLGFKT
jgi:hypothetical protein